MAERRGCAIEARLSDPWTQQHFAAAQIDIGALLSPLVANAAVYGPEFSRQALTDINTDLFPRDEFDLSPR